MRLHTISDTAHAMEDRIARAGEDSDHFSTDVDGLLNLLEYLDSDDP